MPDVVLFRLSSWDTPFWVNPNRHAGRYNRALTGPTQYFCEHPLGPWAELMRWQNLRTLEELLEIRHRMWAVKLDAGLAAGAFELSFENAAAVGLEAEQLVADDHAACRELAETWRADANRPKIWRVPSAALPGTSNVVIFGPRTAIAFQRGSLDPMIDLPAAVAADRASPPHQLLPLVRYQGMDHAGVVAWRSGVDHVFEEPAFPIEDRN